MLNKLPVHNQASYYSRLNLFDGLTSFSELERRISDLPSEKERGDAFEVFVEAYLNIDEVIQAEDVWVVGKIPLDIRESLNLPASDYGYDGVFKTRLGELVAYQAKFRTGRVALPYRELSTFFGISENADRRLVITNSVGIAEVAQSRTNFNATRGTDFDRLDDLQLFQISEWIKGKKLQLESRYPRPHQIAALEDISNEFITKDRATAVMACGSGKTLVALWAAERSDANRILVLVPSLNLLRQTLHEWSKWTSWGTRFRYLCVCSDENIASGIDEIEIRPEDVDFPVRTDPSIVKKFLDGGGDSVSVVFCTYQSAPIVGAAVSGGRGFDFGIFDEAHKTTGLEGSRFTFALSNQNLEIHKRLFLTATPRHYRLNSRNKDGDLPLISMDDKVVYGRVAHRLSFAEAIKEKIIVPYKVVISIVDSDTIDSRLLANSDVVVDGELVRAKWVANQIALKQAVDDYGVKRIITFHSRVSAAATFTSDSFDGIGQYLPSFKRFYVSGKQATALREEQMLEFARAERGIIANARCLTEGVDVPSVDMVAFMNPRRSRVDIVQAVGRAMRISDKEKKYGYVFIPLFLQLQQGETLTEALARSDFSEIALVLNAMRENDETLNDLIEKLVIDKGRFGKFDESTLMDRVEVIGSQIKLSDLAASIRTRIVYDLGSSWDERYGELLAFNQQYGVSSVPAGWPENPGLAAWCSTQKQARLSNTLTEERFNKLENIGFTWVDRRQERQSSSILVDEIRERKGIFEKGIVGSPFDSVCKRFCLTMKSVFPPGTKIPTEALLSALKEAGWIDCGRLQSREAPSKKHVFAAPELVKLLSKSDLRRLLDDKDLTDIKTQSLISSGTKALSAYEFIMEQINNKADIFANGIVGSPFHSICSYLSNTNPSKIQISVGLLITALKDAGWVDCGRLKSREIDTKKHIFATIELVKNYSKSDLRRMVDSLPAYQSIERSITFNAELNETLLLAEIRNRRGIFSVGIIGSPFDLICKQLTHLTSNGIKMPKTALLNALKEAGWVDCGRLNSREATSKKHIFAVPELATSLSKSDLRRAVDS